MKVGIITGASSGIGREFAIQAQTAFSLDEIWLIARKKNQLAETASMMDRIKPVILPLDLTKSEELSLLSRKIREESPEIGLLVNSAGYGHDGRFEEVPIGIHLNMIDLNIKALVEITHACIPRMKSGGVIFQVASTNAFMPIPNAACYAATKAFVLNFSHALFQELKGKGVHVITVSPKAVNTNYFSIARESKKAPPDSASASQVVGKAIRDAKKGRINSTHGVIPKVDILLSKLLSRKALLKRLGG